MTAANRYLDEVYRPAFNAEFMPPALEEGSAFVPWIGGKLDDFLCETFERVVGKDNCVAFEGMALQIPKDRHRMHYMKVKVRVHRYPDGNLTVFHGPRCLARPERRHFSRNPKWGPSDFGCKKSGDGHGLRQPTFVLRPSRRALRSSLTLPRFPVLLLMMPKVSRFRYSYRWSRRSAAVSKADS